MSDDDYDDVVQEAATVALGLYFDRDNVEYLAFFEEIVMRAVALRGGVHGDQIDKSILAAVVDEACAALVDRLESALPHAAEQVAAGLDDIRRRFSDKLKH